MIAADDLGLFHYADSPTEALAALKQAMTPDASLKAPEFAHSTTTEDPAAPRHPRTAPATE
jgi:hypothetical protein